MLADAISHYHSLLDAATAEETQRLIDARLRERDLFFGTRPLTTVLRPRLISAEQYAFAQRACNLVAAASNTLAARMLEDAALRQRIGLTPLEDQLVLADPGYSDPSAHGRMDTFLTIDGTSLQFVEYNAESPAAIAYQDELTELFYDLPVMQRFAERYRVDEIPGKPHMLATVRRVFQEFGGQGEPQIAIVDWAGLPTASEFRLFQRYFSEHGIATLICTPDDLAYRDGRLYATDPASGQPATAVNFVYKRVLVSELLTHYGDAFLKHPLARAYLDGAVCMLNSFRGKLLHKKMLFGLLSDEDLWPLFGSDEQQAIARHVPWTRAVAAGETRYQGARVDLLPFITKHRERFVLKPNDEYGGKGVLIGWECSDAEWGAALSEAARSPYIVQERVTIAYEDYPALVDGALQIGPRLVDTDPFLFGGETHGCLVRLSTVTLLNVTAGGGSTVPAFLIAPKTEEEA